MANEDQIRSLHNATDRLLEEATEDLADLIAQHGIQMRSDKWEQSRSLMGSVTVLDGFQSRGRNLHEVMKKNIEVNCEAYSTVMFLDPRASREIYFGLAQYGPKILHFLSHGDGTLVIEPLAPLNFGKLLKAVRRQIEVGDAVSPSEHTTARQSKGCAVVLIFLGAGAASLTYIGHVSGLF